MKGRLFRRRMQVALRLHGEINADFSDDEEDGDEKEKEEQEENNEKKEENKRKRKKNRRKTGEITSQQMAVIKKSLK